MRHVISELDVGDIPQACELFHNVFGVTISPAHWRWKYLEGPRLAGLNLVTHADNGDLVGHVGSSIFPGVMGGVAVSMAQLCDFMVHSSARGGYSASTVYPKLMKAMQHALINRFAAPYAYGFAGVRQFKLGIRLGYYRSIESYRPAYATPDKVAAFWQAKACDWDLQRLDRIWRRRVSGIRRPMVARSGAYLGWRYRDHPTNPYQLWILSHLSRDRGWFITRTMPNGEVCVVDALLPGDANPSRLLATLASALASTLPALPPIYSWFFQSETNRQIEPVIGGEFQLGQWHSHDPDPIFQPGDTDVF